MIPRDQRASHLQGGDPARVAAAPTAGTPDEELVARACADPTGAAGREAASELLGRYKARVYGWCFRSARDHERALDLSQEALIKAYRALGAYQGRSLFSSWLFAIVRNVCVSAARGPRLLTDPEADPDAVASSDRNASDLLEEREDEDALLEIVKASIDPEEQEALWLRCYEGLSVEEITEVLGMTQSSGARGVLQAARRKLRAALEKRRSPEES